MKRKIIISPNHNIAEYWCRQMGLSRDQIKVITPHTRGGYRGIEPEDVYAYLYEETFDFPEDVDPNFKDFCEEVELYLEYKNREKPPHPRRGGKEKFMTIRICTGSHGGINNVCDSCKLNMENQPDFKGLAWEPEGKYEFVDEMICRLPMGPERKYWVQYETMHQTN